MDQPMIWKTRPTLAELDRHSIDTAVAHLGIEFIEVGNDFLRARMPVDARTVQPMRLLHGGASVLLAESIASTAAWLCLDGATQSAVGLEISANHVRGVSSGWVIATAKPFHVGRATHVWGIEIHDEAGRLVCVARLTVAVLERPGLRV